jgi:hypothetical protein
VLLDSIRHVDPCPGGVLTAVLHSSSTETAANIGMATHSSSHTSAVVEDTEGTRLVHTTQAIHELAFGERVDLLLREDLMEGIDPCGGI